MVSKPPHTDRDTFRLTECSRYQTYYWYVLRETLESQLHIVINTNQVHSNYPSSYEGNLQREVAR